MLTYEDIQGACSIVEDHGKYFATICPFHSDRDPSLLVYKDGWFRCLGCNRQGTWKTLWNKLKGQPSQIMPERQTRWATPKIHHSSLEDVCYQAHMDLLGFPSLGWYLEMRGIEDRVEINEIGYWEGWYTIPVKDQEGKFITAVFRAAPHVQEATGLRYWCPHGAEMFVPDWFLFRRRTNQAIAVVYGMFDALSLSSLRIPVATTTAGQLTFKPEWLDEYRMNIFVIPDKGEERAAARLVSGLGWRGRMLRLEYPDGIKDPAGFKEAGKEDELIKQLGGLL